MAKLLTTMHSLVKLIEEQNNAHGKTRRCHGRLVGRE